MSSKSTRDGYVNGRHATGGDDPASFSDARPGSMPVLRPPEAFLTMAANRHDGEPTRLWCDPLTGLVAYPSFAEHLTECLPFLCAGGVHLAIGDVDDLKEYVTQRRAEDPTCFGHLAGNACMEVVGRVTRAWAARVLSDCPFALCGTFGGDEVIVAVAGPSYDAFIASIRELLTDIGRTAPRTCSFAAGTLVADHIPAEQRMNAYREFVSQVDAGLFAHKAELRSQNIKPRGHFKDIGPVVLSTGQSAGAVRLSAAGQAGRQESTQAFHEVVEAP